MHSNTKLFCQIEIYSFELFIEISISMINFLKGSQKFYKQILLLIDPRTKGLFKNGVFNSQTFRAWTSLKPSSELPQPYKEVFAKATYKFASLLRLDMLKDIDDNMFNKLIDLITELKLVLKTNSFVVGFFFKGQPNHITLYIYITFTIIIFLFFLF